MLRDRDHAVRFAIGAGVEPQLHAPFEQRFGFPLIEIWGMTEMVRALVDNQPPRQVGTRAFGRAMPGLEVRVVDEAEAEVPDGTPGEMLIRHSAATPRKDFFSGYLDDAQATEQAWRGGWFHTGDIVSRAADGMLHFVDRRKNIIRRSGENIAAAEVEALLLTHPLVEQVAVLAVPDEVREQEVLACVVLRDAARADVDAAVRTLFDFCHAQLAYYKAPGLAVADRAHPDHRDPEDPEAPDLRRRRRPAHRGRHARPARLEEARRAAAAGAPADTRGGRMGWYYEDFEPGRTIVTPGRTITEADIAAFAGLSGDFNPLHTDEVFAREAGLGGRIAHGPMVLGMAFGLGARAGLFDETVLGLLGVQWTFEQVVRPGDTLRASIVVLDMRTTRRPDRGIVRPATGHLEPGPRAGADGSLPDHVQTPGRGRRSDHAPRDTADKSIPGYTGGLTTPPVARAASAVAAGDAARAVPA